VQFFCLERHPRGVADVCFKKEKNFNQTDPTYCPVCGDPVSMLRWLPPFRVILEVFGEEFGDFAFMGGSDDFLVSQRFREVYFQSGLTGLLGFDPVDVIRVESHGKGLSGPPKYFCVRPHYGETELDLAASGFEWEDQPTCSRCFTADVVRWKRLVIKSSSWTGEDIFCPRGLSSAILVSMRFKEACERNGVKNAVFIPAEESGYDFNPGAVTPRFRAPQ